MKLWLMLANSMSTVVPGGESLVASMWNELWAAYEGFLDVLETEAQVGQYPVRYNPRRCCSLLTSLADTHSPGFNVHCRCPYVYAVCEDIPGS